MHFTISARTILFLWNHNDHLCMASSKNYEAILPIKSLIFDWIPSNYHKADYSVLFWTPKWPSLANRISSENEKIKQKKNFGQNFAISGLI